MTTYNAAQVSLHHVAEGVNQDNETDVIIATRFRTNHAMQCALALTKDDATKLVAELQVLLKLPTFRTSPFSVN